MTMLPALLLLLAATRVELVDDVFEIPAREWRYVELNLRQEPVSVLCHFDTGGQAAVRVALLRREDLERLREERPHGVAAVTRMASRGELGHTVVVPGHYAVVVDNSENGTPASVHLRVALDFNAANAPYVRTVSPQRRAAVIAISFVFLFGIAAYAGRKLLRGMRPHG